MVPEPDRDHLLALEHVRVRGRPARHFAHPIETALERDARIARLVGDLAADLEEADHVGLSLQVLSLEPPARDDEAERGDETERRDQLGPPSVGARFVSS